MSIKKRSLPRIIWWGNKKCISWICQAEAKYFNCRCRTSCQHHVWWISRYGRLHESFHKSSYSLINYRWKQQYTYQNSYKLDARIKIQIKYLCINSMTHNVIFFTKKYGFHIQSYYRATFQQDSNSDLIHKNEIERDYSTKQRNRNKANQ